MIYCIYIHFCGHLRIDVLVVDVYYCTCLFYAHHKTNTHTKLLEPACRRASIASTALRNRPCTKQQSTSVPTRTRGAGVGSLVERQTRNKLYSRCRCWVFTRSMLFLISRAAQEQVISWGIQDTLEFQPFPTFVPHARSVTSRIPRRVSDSSLLYVQLILRISI